MSLDIFNFLQKKQHVRINKLDDSLKIKFRFFYFLTHCLTWYSVQYGSGLPYIILKTLLLSQTSRHVIIYLEHYCHPNIFQLVLRRQIRSIIGVTRTREWVTAVWNVQLLPSLSECAGPLSIPFKVPDSSPRSRWTFHTAIMAMPLRLVPREGFPYHQIRNRKSSVGLHLIKLALYLMSKKTRKLSNVALLTLSSLNF